MSGYEELRSGAAFLDLSARGKLLLTGEDRARLLHAMCTNDVEHLKADAGVYAFFLSAQGRILADANVFNLGDRLFLDVESGTVESLSAHLNKYIIADDVTVDDITSKWIAIGLEGPQSVEAAVRAGLPVPADHLATVSFDSGFVARVASSANEGIRVFLPAEQRSAFLEKLHAAEIAEATAQEADIVRLENKLPRYGDEISDCYLVAETQQLQGVHFNKGCYIGQEIVERVRSQGKVHRLLTPIVITGKILPTKGAKILAGEKEVGEVTSAAWSPALEQVVGFAYLRGDGLQPTAELTVKLESVTEQASIRL